MLQVHQKAMMADGQWTLYSQHFFNTPAPSGGNGLGPIVANWENSAHHNGSFSCSFLSGCCL